MRTKFAFILLLFMTARSVGFGQTNSANTSVSTTTLDNGDTMVTMCVFTVNSGTTFSCYYPISSNQVVTINSFLSPSSANTTVRLYFNGGTNNYTYINPGNNFSSTFSQAPLSVKNQFTGVTMIGLFGNNPGIFTFTVHTPNPQTNNISFVPSQSVVIPSSYSGNFQVILESSSDLINWFPTQTGNYNSSSFTNRFFRVKALTQ